ncbi:uncharacterized protein LOC108908699 [Anoplophora glabripennis]|uniref:uncharacterized protein LOC108908699 n=1 Tax=Anoplophora glabripennis TaxID=217634 RepID=UPI0008748F3A|nr:uncharacterized protein LOC108908699 [Anoplophora glabripennis]
MSSQLTVEQNDCIRKIAENENISDYLLEVSSGSVKGDGYLGIMSTVNIISERKKLNLIIKTAETNEELRKKIVIRKAYLREMFTYNKIFLEFENFQRKRNMRNGFTAFAKIYGSCDEDCKEFLIFENLKEVGYKLWNRKVPMDAEHVALVFSEYGKFHAVSLAIRDQDPEMYKELTKDLMSIFEDSYSKEEFDHAAKINIDKGFRAVKGDNNATEALRRFSDSLATLFEHFNIPENGIVINHGDCWCNNMMFKYGDSRNTHKPTKVCLLDWQLTKTGSPVYDLAYFFFACGSKDIFYDYKKYLKIYHETVSKNLIELSCDPEKIFPYTLLEHHWKMHAKFGLFMALMVLTVMLSEVEEVKELTDAVENNESIFETFNYDGININEYNKRILDIVTFMAEHELI